MRHTESDTESDRRCGTERVWLARLMLIMDVIDNLGIGLLWTRCMPQCWSNPMHIIVACGVVILSIACAGFTQQISLVMHNLTH